MGPCCRNADINDEPPALHIFPDMRSKANKKNRKFILVLSLERLIPAVLIE